MPLVISEMEHLRSEEPDQAPGSQPEPARAVLFPVRRVAGRVSAHAVMAALSVFTLGPIVWMYVTSFRPGNDLLSSHLLAGGPTVSNYRAALGGFSWLHVLANTVAMSAAITAAQLLTGLLAAYAFSCWSFRGQKVLFLAFLLTWMVPFQVTMLPNYVELSHLGLLDSLPGVILPQLASALAILLLRQHLRAFPKDLLDAARVDGQSSFVTLWRVVVPNLAPALAALAILLFVQQWNEYFWPLLVYRQPVSVLQLGIQSFLSLQATDYGGLMAASGLACLPIFALYLVLQRRVVNAFVRSGLR